MRTRTCAHEDGPMHDCAYVDARNELIDLAAAAADIAHPEPVGVPAPERAAWAWRWDAEYHRTMARLAQ